MRRSDRCQGSRSRPWDTIERFVTEVGDENGSLNEARAIHEVQARTRLRNGGLSPSTSPGDRSHRIQARPSARKLCSRI